MNQALWEQCPPPVDADATPLGRWNPVRLADLTASRRELSAGLHDGRRPAGADESAVQTLTLAFEELASNALRHGRLPVLVSVTASDRYWLLQVTDAAGDSAPTPAPGRDAAHGGLGLPLVAEITDDHGWSRETRGRKTVWALVGFRSRHPITRPG